MSALVMANLCTTHLAEVHRRALDHIYLQDDSNSILLDNIFNLPIRIGMGAARRYAYKGGKSLKTLLR